MISRQNGADDENHEHEGENDSEENENEFHIGCFIIPCGLRQELESSQSCRAVFWIKPVQELPDAFLIQHRGGRDGLSAASRQTQLALSFVRRRRFAGEVTEAAEPGEGGGKGGGRHSQMRRECARIDRILTIQMREDRSI